MLKANIVCLVFWRNLDVDAFASVSSGIMYEHPSGLPRSSPDYDPLDLRVPWFHSISASWLQFPESQSTESLFDTAINSQRYLLLTEGMEHVDFTSYALIEARRPMAGYWPAAQPAALEGHKAVNQYISSFFAANLKHDDRALTFLSQDPKNSTMTLERRSAAHASITYKEFVQAVLTGEAERAINEVRALRKSEPGHIFLKETYLQRLLASLRNTWGLNEEATQIIQFLSELYPESDDTLLMLAERHVNSKEYSAAIKVFEKLLKRYPQNDYLQSRLKSLRSQ